MTPSNPSPKGLGKLFRAFISSEQTGGIILVAMAGFSLILAQTPMGPGYAAFWKTLVGTNLFGLHLEHSLVNWINDGLMAIFFLLIGLEIEREIYTGQLSRLRTASLPFFAALGGMVIPVLIHLFFNYGSHTQAGAGIPMATDIAFALAVLALLGNRVPLSLKVFLAAFAIIDDLGAILIIAIFYGKGISWAFLLLSLGVFLILLTLNRLRVHHLWPYLTLGVVLWYLIGQSGIHASVAGVLLAFAVPYAGGVSGSPSTILQHRIHGWVAYFILPLFALANTVIHLSPDLFSSQMGPNSLGILLGSVVGKPIGIVVFSWMAIKLGLSSLPSEMTRRHLFGVGLLGGVGFTMAIFIAELAFLDVEQVDGSKLTILIGSLLSGSMAYLVLRFWGRKPLPAKSLFVSPPR